MNISKEFSWLPVGAEKASKTLFNWIKEPRKRDEVMKRLGVAASVPVGSLLLVAHNPPFSIAGIAVVSVGVCAWFGYESSREMVIHEREYALPYEIHGEPMTAKEVLKKFIDSHPEEGIESLANRLSRTLESGRVSPDLLERELRFWGLPVPRQGNPSPTDEVDPFSSGSPSSPAPTEEEAGEGLTNHVYEAGLSNMDEVASDHAREEDREGCFGEAGAGGVRDERSIFT